MYSGRREQTAQFFGTWQEGWERSTGDPQRSVTRRSKGTNEPLTTKGSDKEPTSRFCRPVTDSDRCTRAVSPAPAMTAAACGARVPPAGRRRGGQEKEQGGKAKKGTMNMGSKKKVRKQNEERVRPREKHGKKITRSIYVVAR